MSFEPILAFFIVRYLRKSLQAISPDPKWNQILTYTLYGIVTLFVFQFVFHITPVAMWVWHALLLTLMVVIYKNPIFDFAKKIMLAVLPLILLALFSDLFKLIQSKLYLQYKTYIDFAFCVAITWMIATVIKSNRQQKALETERKKTREEQEKSKFIAVQKDKLEELVNERTAEILKQKDDLQHALTELRETQALLIQSEKMASLGELTAGIAHEIQNPLNFVNNFSEVNTELIEELKSERLKPKAERDEKLEVEILNDIKQNLEKINHHGKRADAIVKGMLQHSRISTGVKEPTDINVLADEYLRLSYHGLRAKDKNFNADMKTDFDESIPKINIVTQDVGRVILNLITNAFYAVKAAKPIKGDDYEPTVWVSTKKENGKILVKVRDNGTGIPDKVKDKIFNPFFTTKPAGEGTGLGLSLSYDIIKAHGGMITVDSKEGEGAEFTVELPMT